MIPALVLTAGLGTRLRPLSYVRAKGALPLAGEALARRILRGLRHAGVTEAVLNLHHLPHTLTRTIGDGSDLGIRVRYSWETPVLGSAGGPRRALSLLSSGAAGGAFLIVNGDTLTDVNVADLVAAHRDSDAWVTMAVVPNTQPDKYGGIIADERGNLVDFVPRGSIVPSFHFVGVQVATPEAFASVPPDVPHEVRALYPALSATRPGRVRVHVTTADFFDIGTPADYLSTALAIAQRDRSRSRGTPEGVPHGGDSSGTPEGVPYGVDAGARVRIAADARIERSVLWDDVVVQEGAMLKECVVTDGVVVPADTSWHGVTLRVPGSELAKGERVIEGMAVCPL
jgi:mannose-1-phosphate guanylyltransferase